MSDDAESGHIMLLTVALGAVVLALVLVVASATALHIERKRLLALADSAAAAAADALDETAYFRDPDGGDHLPVSDAAVVAAVEEHLAATPAPVVEEFAGRAVAAPTGTPDGVTVEVTLAAVARPPFVPWALVPWSDGITLRVTSQAVAQRTG